MKPVVHNKHARLEALNEMISDALVVLCVANASKLIEVSDVKRDGTIFIRFKSFDSTSAIEATEAFGQYLTNVKIAFEQVDDVRIRMTLP